MNQMNGSGCCCDHVAARIPIKGVCIGIDPYELCEFYYFRHPKLKPGFVPAQGGLLENAAEFYPEAWSYLQTEDGKLLCTTESEWQAMTRAAWANLADGTTVGWNGIGGAPFYAPDFATGALRLPDLRGMYAEGAGFDGLNVGGAHGDGIRNIAGQFGLARWMGHPTVSLYTGPFTPSAPNGNLTGWDDPNHGYGIVHFNAARSVPTAFKNQPRAWGALPCVYLGAPK